MRSSIRRFLFVCGVLAVCALPASATVVMALTIEEMTAMSPVVVRGVVKRTEVGWDDGHRSIWTWAEVEVRESLKGGARKFALVKQPGGVIHPIGQTVSGAATFEPGEDVVLFLEPAVDVPDAFVPYSMSAAKVSLVQKGGQTVALRDLSGLSFAVPGQKGVIRPVDERETLGVADAFLDRVRLAVKKGGAR